MLTFENVTLSYFSNNGETKALDDISFKVNKGEFVSIVGPSGCGKSTILSLISKLIQPTKGQIIIQSNNKFPCGYMFQKDLLLEWRTVLKNIQLGLEIQKNNKKDNSQYIESLLKKYGLWEFRNKFPSQLSGGMRQRVSLIRTLALNPDLMLLDESFSALDYQTRLNVCDDVYKILKQEKITTILVTHDITEAISMSDKIIVLSKRPATIKNIHTIDLPTTLTPLQRRESGQINKYFDVLWKELQNEN